MSGSGRFVWAAVLLAGHGLAASAADPPPHPEPLLPTIKPSIGVPSTVPVRSTALDLDNLIQMSLSRHPRLAQAGYDIQAARGRVVQAGKYPNPTISGIIDELGDVQGPGGINTLPLITQEIVTAGKLKLDRAVANLQKSQSELALTVRKYELISEVRSAFIDVLAAERRIEILAELVKLATQSFEQTEKYVKARQAAELELIQMRVELNRARAEQEAADRERAAALRRLAAVAGVPEVLACALAGSLDTPLPEYDFDIARDYIVEAHPEVASARIGVDRAQFAMKRAKAAAIPNVTVGAGYVRQNQNQSNDWTLQVSMPVPLWDRNQGNRLAAQADVGRSIEEIGRVQLDLNNRLATAHGRYAAAKKRAERYRESILPDTNETYKLALQAFKGGQFEYLRVIQAQRSLSEANLEYVRALAEAWRAAAEVSGLLLEDHWPAVPAAPAK